MNRLKSVVVFFISLAFSCSSIGKESDKEKDELHQSTVAAMQTLMDGFGLPSLSVAVAVDGKIVFAEALGYADTELKTLANAETQYSVGSIAKPMTAIALGKLMDARQVELDSDVRNYVSWGDKKITIRQLASHTAGIPHDTPERDQREFINVRDHKSPLEAIDVFTGHALLFEPGSDFKYSSNGYILLSAVIEAASGQNFVDYIGNAVLAELGMTHTELDLAGRSKNEARYYKGRTKDGAFIPASEKRDRSFLFGAGGFISTPTDLVKMSAAFYRENYLSEKTKEIMLTPVKLANGTTNPQKYGLGWRTGQATSQKDGAETLRIAHHGGVTDGAATAYLFVVPERKAAIAFATNTVPDQSWKIRPAMENVLLGYLSKQ